MSKFSSSFKLNEIHTDDSPFNEDPNNIIFFREALMSGEGWLEKLRSMDSNRDIYCYANRGVVNFERAYQPLTLVCDASIFLHTRPIFRKK